MAGVVTTTLVMLYPLAIWFGLTHFSARTVGLWILALLVPTALYRFRKARREDVLAVLRVPIVVALVVGLGVLTDDARFVLAMPVLINAVLLVTFAGSLRGVPMIERFARMQEPELSEAQRAHCRQVTWAWIFFFFLNGLCAALLALFASRFWWAAYNGGVAYGLMGAMFAGEYVLRQFRFRKYGEGLHDRLLARLFPPREGA
ncbi:MAG: hypothetical protein RLP09_12055 [Sandaracinaceae bacterium]